MLESLFPKMFLNPALVARRPAAALAPEEEPGLLPEADFEVA